MHVEIHLEVVGCVIRPRRAVEVPGVMGVGLSVPLTARRSRPGCVRYNQAVEDSEKGIVLKPIVRAVGAQAKEADQPQANHHQRNRENTAR